MALDAFVENLDNVPEALRGEYKEIDGGYQLDVTTTNGFALENVEGLKSALGKERNNVSSLNKELNKIKKEFDGIDPVELIGTKAQLEDLQKKYDELSAIDPAKEADALADKKAADLLAKKQKEWEKQYNKEIGSRDERLNGLTSQLHEVMVKSVAVQALAENGAGDSVDLLLPHVLKNVKLSENEGKVEVHVIDSEGNPRVKGDGKNMTITDLMPEFKEKWPNAFNAKVKPGGGTPSNPKGTGGPKGGDMSSLDMINQGLEGLKR